MKNIKGNIIWGFVLLVWILVLVIPTSRTVFLDVTGAHPYIGGFVKFFILATMGDLLGARILRGEWSIPKGFFFKAVLWGILGMAITLVFTVFMAGAEVAQASGKLPFAGVTLAQAFFGSLVMNTTFGPMLYIYHKFGDLYIEAKIDKIAQKRKERITVKELVAKVDWNMIVGFFWLKTCVFVWIPAHTIVFLLPVEYRVVASAFLSILLGIIVALSKKSSMKKVETVKA